MSIEEEQEELRTKIAKYRLMMPMLDQLTARRVRSLIEDLEQLLGQMKTK